MYVLLCSVIYFNTVILVWIKYPYVVVDVGSSVVQSVLN